MSSHRDDTDPFDDCNAAVAATASEDACIASEASGEGGDAVADFDLQAALDPAFDPDLAAAPDQDMEPDLGAEEILELADLECMNAEPKMDETAIVGPLAVRASHSTRRSGRSVPEVVVVVPPTTWSGIREAMLAARSAGNEEVFGFLLCSRHLTKDQDRYLARHWAVPATGDYVTQSIGGLTLSQDIHAEVLMRAVEEGLHVVHLHTHPGWHRPAFSGRDDGNEVSLADSYRYLPGQPRLLSGVFNQDMTEGVFRIWEADGLAVRPARLVTGWIPTIAGATDGLGMDGINPDLFDRQRIFGEPFQRQLGQLRVALIGCGGLGSIVAEELSRLGVRRWVLVDDDRLETTNLHRLPFSTRAMVERGMSKVAYVGSLIQRFWGDAASVRGHQHPINRPHVQRAVAEADLIIAATDNHASRLVAQELALRYLRPLLSVATQIERRQGEDQPRIMGRVTMPPVGGGWCLPCSGAISLTRAAEERADPHTREHLRAGGYLPEVAAPAVYWVNGATASLAVGLIHGALAGFVETSEGSDELFDLAGRVVMPVEQGSDGPCFLCHPAGVLVGAGEAARSPTFTLAG